MIKGQESDLTNPKNKVRQNKTKRKMKHLLLNVLFMMVITTIVSGQKFTTYEDVGEDECVVYVYRLKSMVGGAVKWPVSTMRFNEESGKFMKGQAVEYGKLNKKEYKALRLKANTFYWIAIGEGHSVLFAGTKGSETIIQTKGVKSATTTIKGEALTRTNSESGFKITEGDFKTWSNAIKNVDSFTNLNLSNDLMEYGFQILKSNSNSDLYKELKNMKKSKH